MGILLISGKIMFRLFNQNTSQNMLNNKIWEIQNIAKNECNVFIDGNSEKISILIRLFEGESLSQEESDDDNGSLIPNFFSNPNLILWKNTVIPLDHARKIFKLTLLSEMLNYLLEEKPSQHILAKQIATLYANQLKEELNLNFFNYYQPDLYHTKNMLLPSLLFFLILYLLEKYIYNAVTYRENIFKLNAVNEYTILILAFHIALGIMLPLIIDLLAPCLPTCAKQYLHNKTKQLKDEFEHKLSTALSDCISTEEETLAIQALRFHP